MSSEYVERFSYRKYTGTSTGRKSRIWSLAKFEIISTWRKSTLGKVLLIILIIFNILLALVTFQITPLLLAEVGDLDRQMLVRDAMSSIIGSYFSLGPNFILSSPPSDSFSIDFEIQLGFIIITLIGIAGSGFFADDRAGRVVEVYLSRITREEYAIGKLIGMFIYTNIFTTVPLIFTTILYVQGFGGDHFLLLGLYAGVLFFGLFVSLLLGLVILILSTLIEKRAYASLSFFLIFLLGSIFGGPIFFLNEGTNEFLLLLSPNNFLSLLAYSFIGDFELGVQAGFGSTSPLLLNDGLGLEAIHIIGIAFGLLLVLFTFLLYKIHGITTEEL